MKSMDAEGSSKIMSLFLYKLRPNKVKNPLIMIS